MFDFEKFPVYIASEKTFELIEKHLIHRKDISAKIIDQLERASSSTILNIAEGAGKYSKKEKKNYYLTSRASAQECVAIIRIMKIQRKISPELFEEIYNNLELIAKMLTGLINHFLKG